jgi:hypothetical protein
MRDETFGYSELLPKNIREIFMWLCQDVAFLRSKWSFYLGLFSSEEDTAMLSELALASFNIIEEALRSDMTMAICRLSDPPTMGKHRNLSLQTLSEECDHIEGVSELTERFLASCKPIRRHRNKRVGHNDLSTTVKPREDPLPGIGKGQIEEILETAETILNVIYQNWVHSELVFQPLLIGEADALLYWLRLAKRASRQQ